MADLKISQLTGASTPLAGTEVLPIVQSGSTVKVSVANLTTGRAVASAGGTFSDNFVQGTAAKGVNFTANTPAAGMTSQLLNWYEEGTWTPSLGGNATYTTRLARYVRVGKQVTVSFVIQVNAIGTGSTTTISDLPFAVANNNQYHNAGSLAYFDSLAISVVSIVPRAVWNTSTMDFTVLTAAATASTTTAAIFQNGTYLIGNVTYLVD